MKIEKLTENKIRIILKQEDLKDKSINLTNIFLAVPESQKFFLEILNKAKKEVNFNTDGYKLLIETYAEYDDIFVFIITKYLEQISKSQKKHLTVKRNHHFPNLSYAVYKFSNFDNFCNLCISLKQNNKINLKGLFKTSTLYFYNNTYYLVIENINASHKSLNIFNNLLSEFSTFMSYDINFSSKLKEHGKIIIKNNAILNGQKYFAK